MDQSGPSVLQGQRVSVVRVHIFQHAPSVRENLDLGLVNEAKSIELEEERNGNGSTNGKNPKT